MDIRVRTRNKGKEGWGKIETWTARVERGIFNDYLELNPRMIGVAIVEPTVNLGLNCYFYYLWLPLTLVLVGGAGWWGKQKKHKSKPQKNLSLK